MENQVVNPFLPLDEYIPDGEPHVFGDRIYLYGSHDTEGGTIAQKEIMYAGPLLLTIWRIGHMKGKYFRRNKIRNIKKE